MRTGYEMEVIFVSIKFEADNFELFCDGKIELPKLAAQNDIFYNGMNRETFYNGKCLLLPFSKL
jgi:hypothetical protein